MELIIGNKNYSSWSLRGWLMLKAFDLPFTETRLALREANFYSSLANYSPAGKVPVLIDNGIPGTVYLIQFYRIPGTVYLIPFLQDSGDSLLQDSGDSLLNSILT